MVDVPEDPGFAHPHPQPRSPPAVSSKRPFTSFETDAYEVTHTHRPPSRAQTLNKIKTPKAYKKTDKKVPDSRSIVEISPTLPLPGKILDHHSLTTSQSSVDATTPALYPVSSAADHHYSIASASELVDGIYQTSPRVMIF